MIILFLSDISQIAVKSNELLIWAEDFHIKTQVIIQLVLESISCICCVHQSKFPFGFAIHLCSKYNMNPLNAWIVVLCQLHFNKNGVNKMTTVLANASDLIIPKQQIAALENTQQTWIKCQQRPGTSQQPNVHQQNSC